MEGIYFTTNFPYASAYAKPSKQKEGYKAFLL